MHLSRNILAVFKSQKVDLGLIVLMVETCSNRHCHLDHKETAFPR
jgi:hypothetical protein